ncbi:hypothetical protein Pmani_031025, partial [Petrolisthes manimaculis]
DLEPSRLSIHAISNRISQPATSSTDIPGDGGISEGQDEEGDPSLAFNSLLFALSSLTHHLQPPALNPCPPFSPSPLSSVHSPSPSGIQ